ncbi:MAG: PEP-CTERM sorting domain-containing protein [Phycisphaerales bacterium]|nr:PEP-CTERM sorting domain-containing protein [Planctomycetota bacterium]MCH8507376.1 PEP-CTERM sorting domain-containing protein [Phycisphaerales bacterium]
MSILTRSVAAIGLAGLACGAGAQNIATDLRVDLTFDQTYYWINAVGTATITASWNGVPGSHFSSFHADLIASTSAIQVLEVAPIAWNNPALGFTGSPAWISGGNIFGLEASQWWLIPPFLADNPILVTTFTFVVLESFHTLSYSVQPAADAPSPFWVAGPVFSDPWVDFGVDAFFSETVGFVPAPGALALLGLGGLAATRRRR